MKLFMVLLGSKAPKRNVEQHDFFFGIAEKLGDLKQQFVGFWPEAGNSLHIDGWREINFVDGYRVDIMPGQDYGNNKRIFFINLGGYTSGKLEEQHYTLLTVQDDRISALKASKMTAFFRTATIKGLKGADAHIDEKYGIDVDDIYRIEDLLSPETKARWHIHLTAVENASVDEVHLGYLKMSQLG
ncbi:protein of unknown function [Mucilaginibacter gossypiicola]|uniref:DUF1543 domain-containing protein n=1 Tax=Mucilaginibacter gossypiicola TaxID=551995 RepID=A0A1H8KU53_9SPHI|nr:DUF1543 domain-containing protein [Mucilaginibacter gossypiicola]SEN96417.1 protein of unknown function [Mucilaginibacter gossypiicola]